MGTSWIEADPKARQPSLDDLVASVRRIRFVSAGEPPPALAELAGLLRALLDMDNGGVIARTFQVADADEAAAWYLSHNNFNTYGLIEQLLKSDAVTALASGSGTYDPRAASRTFEQTSALHLDGDLAGALVWAGRYTTFEGSHADAKRLGLAVCAEMFGDAWEDVRVHQSTAPWSPWFWDVAWDHSWIITNMRTKQMTLLALTDTD